jgi:type IV pilus assembly protein PilM
VGSRPWVGLDIGSFSLKLLAAPSGAGGARAVFAETLRPPGDGDKGPSPEAMAEAIAECFSQAGLSPRGVRGVTLGVAGVDVIVKQISLPLLDESEVASALRFEARKHLPFDPATMTIDFQVLGRYPSEKRIDLLLAAVANDRLQRLVAPLHVLGIESQIVDAAPLALTNALAHAQSGERAAHILLDLGHTSSHLTLYNKGEPYFSRRLDFGGRSITHAIARDTQVPFEEAEEWKLAAGSDEPGFRVDWGSREMQAVSECLRRDLVEELLRSFAFYRTIGHLPDPLRLWISGGSARLPGLAIRLADLLGSPVMLFNPLESPTPPPGEGWTGTGGPQFAQAFGLALRAA